MSKIFETRISEDPETLNVEVRTKIQLCVSREVARSVVSWADVRLGEFVDWTEQHNLEDLKDILYGDIEEELQNLRDTIIKMVPSALRDRLMAQITHAITALNSFEEREI